MNEMVERVALAISGGDDPASILGIHRTRARAAIEVMLEPTTQMGQAIYAAWDKFGEDAVMGPEEAIAIYRAAIAEALK